MKKKVFRVVLVFILLLLVIGGSFSTFILMGKNQTQNLTIDAVDLNSIPDGTYTGQYAGYRWSNTVQVTVQDHRMTDIIVIKPQVFATGETIEQLKAAMLDAQSPVVDTVSGATCDSHAFGKAVGNALKQ